MQSQTGSRQIRTIPQEAGRIHYLDTLRVLAVLMVFVFHASKPFTAGDWHVMNAETSMIATVLFDAFLAPWGMPFFFLLAGATTWFALGRRTGRQFAGERFTRLFIPYLVGAALFTPLQGYFEWKFHLSNGSFGGSYVQFFLDRWGGWNPTIAGTIGYHLWFLIYLFLFSLLALPLLLWLKRSGKSFLSWLERLCDLRGGILIFALLPLLIQAGLRPIFPEEHNWADFIYDLVFFLSGYLIFANERFVQAIRRDRWLVVVAGIIALLGLIGTLAVGQAESMFSNPDTPGYRLFWALAGVDAWCWSIIMLYIGIRFLDFSNQWTHYGQEAVVPFYLIHQPVIIGLAYFVVQWQAGVALKMLLVVLASFAITVAIYWLLVRRLGLLRSLFGMKKVVHSQLEESIPVSPYSARPLP